MKQFSRYISTLYRSTHLVHYVGVTLGSVRKKRNRQESSLPTPKQPPMNAVDFTWGQRDSGALWLAFSLLRDITTQKRAIAAYRAFCQEVVTRLQPSWIITARDIKHWLIVWEAEQQHLANLEAIKPQSTAPRSLPFYGVMEENFVLVAHRCIKEFLHFAPSSSSSSTAMMYLELAVNLSEVRRKTVSSIYWGKANAEARREVWLQLIMLEQQIGFNLERFGQWWDAYVEKIPPDLCFPIPGHLTSEIAQQLRYQARKRWDVRRSIKHLSDFAHEIRERRDRYDPFIRKQLAMGRYA